MKKRVGSGLPLGYLFKQEVTLSNPLYIGIPEDWVTWGSLFAK